MAKEFKDWDKKFTSQEIKEVRDKYYVLDAQLQEDIDKRTHWIYADEIKVWSNVDVRHAVYEAKDAWEWQRFRVALKGLTTRQKLYMLEIRYSGRAHEYNDQLEFCRIQNYIGALVRGGQLAVGTYEVLK
jgi:hypothetical protein